MQKILTILTVFVIGCTATQKLTIQSPIVENNKDVLILSILIRDHLKLTNGREFNLNELYQNDTLKRISNNFQSIELKSNKGYISAFFKFSKSRNNIRIELTSNEREAWLLNKLAEKQMDGRHDGEIQFAFGEQLYHIKKIIVTKVAL